MKNKLALIAITALSVSFFSACSSKEDTTSQQVALLNQLI